MNGRFCLSIKGKSVTLQISCDVIARKCGSVHEKLSANILPKTLKKQTFVIGSDLVW